MLEYAIDFLQIYRNTTRVGGGIAALILGRLDELGNRTKPTYLAQKNSAVKKK